MFLQHPFCSPKPPVFSFPVSGRCSVADLWNAPLSRAHSSLQKLTVGLCFTGGAWLLIAVFLGSFIYGHFTTPGAAIPAVALDLYVIGMVVAMLRLIVGIAQIDYGQPITTIRRQVTKLRMLGSA